jgi:hypothetical protein
MAPGPGLPMPDLTEVLFAALVVILLATCWPGDGPKPRH